MGITPTKGKPHCPDHLTGEARKEWERIIDELDAMGVLVTADRGAVAMYCSAWARWVKAERELASGIVVESPKTKVPMHSLWLTVSNQAQDRMLALGKELGLTPRSRRLMGEAEEVEKTQEDFSV